MPAEHDDALVLRLWDWSETSQNAAVFTRTHGVIRGLAKGSKRPKSPYSGGLELLTVGEVGFIHRPNSDLSLITEWDLRESFPPLHASLPCHFAGMYIADLLYHLLQPRDPHPTLFDESLRALRGLISPDAVHPVLARFQWALLSESGYRPNLGAPAGHADESTDPVSFFPRLGSFAPALDDSEANTGPGWRVRPQTVEVLRDLDARGQAPEGPSLSEAHLPGSVQRASRLLAAYLRTLLDEHLPTASYVFPDLVPN